MKKIEISTQFLCRKAFLQSAVDFQTKSRTWTQAGLLLIYLGGAMGRVHGIAGLAAHSFAG
jgi:hypothetical protein